MTKYKEFLMAHGAILECNSAELARDENYDIEFIIPCVTNTGFVIKYYHVHSNEPDVVVYDRSGACVSVSYSGGKEVKTMTTKTMVFEVYLEDEYTNRPMWIERNVPNDADIEDVILEIQEQGFYVADIVDVYDAVDTEH